MKKIVETLTPLNRVFCSEGYDKAITYLKTHLPFEVHKFTDELNGWVVPPSWDVSSAEIFKDGVSFFKAWHPLHVIALSTSFYGNVNLKTLKKHLHYDHRFHDAIPYHFRQMYRPWDRTWGFCVPRYLYDSLSEGDYRIQIDTKESKGTLKVLTNTIHGYDKATFAFVAHLDHPGQSNDDAAGVAVGIELFKRLRYKEKLKHTYQLILVPEIIGSEFYLNYSWDKFNFIEGCFLEMLGTNTKFSLQEPFTETTYMQWALTKALGDIPHNRGTFKTAACNDEGNWEANDIPMASFSRWPYPEYHSSRDNPDIIFEDKLEEAVQVLERTIDHLETVTHNYKKVRRLFSGTPCLSNPKYNLYVDPGQPAFGELSSQSIKDMRLLMDTFPILRGPLSAERIAEQLNLKLEDVIKYLNMWAEKGLIQTI